MKKIVILTAAALMTVSGFAIADEHQSGGHGGPSASVTAGQQQGQQQQTLSVGGDYYEEGATRSDSGTQRVIYGGEYDLNNVPAVTAPALTTTLTETCMGSTSAGAAASGWGVSFGTTWRDSACVRRLDARELNSLGYRLGAKERMCDDDKNRAALLRAGTPCYLDLPAEEAPPLAAPLPVEEPEEETPALGQNDPFDWSQLGG